MKLQDLVGALAIFVSQGILALAQDCSITSDPRPELGNMNLNGAGQWINLFTNFQFASDSIVRGIEFYSVRVSTGFLSFWRQDSTITDFYHMVGKIAVTSNGSGLQSLTLNKEEQILVKQGDAVAAHYSSIITGSNGVFPYEDRFSGGRTPEISTDDFFIVKAMNHLDNGWQVGHVLDMGPSSLRTRTMPVIVLADCVTCFQDVADEVDNCDEPACPETFYESVTVIATNSTSIEIFCLDEQKDSIWSETYIPVEGDVSHTFTFSPSMCCPFVRFDVTWKDGVEPDFSVTDTRGCSVNDCDRVWCDMK